MERFAEVKRLFLHRAQGQGDGNLISSVLGLRYVTDRNGRLRLADERQGPIALPILRKATDDEGNGRRSG